MVEDAVGDKIQNAGHLLVPGMYHVVQLPDTAAVAVYVQAELNAGHAGGLSLADEPLHVASGALAAKDDWEAAANRLAAFSTHEVKRLVVDLDGGELVGLVVCHYILEAGAQAVVTSSDDKSHSTGIRKEIQVGVGGGGVEDLAQTLLDPLVRLARSVGDERAHIVAAEVDLGQPDHCGVLQEVLPVLGGVGL